MNKCDLRQNQLKGVRIARRNARMLFVQASYAWEVNKNPSEVVIDFFKTRAEILLNSKTSQASGSTLLFDEDFFQTAFRLMVNHKDAIDAWLIPCLSRQVQQVGIIERSILRLATLEMSAFFNIPKKVVMNESVELAKIFGATESFRFVNGVLHALSQKEAPAFSCTKN